MGLIKNEDIRGSWDEDKGVQYAKCSFGFISKEDNIIPTQIIENEDGTFYCDDCKLSL